MTENFFDLFQSHFPELVIKGPKRAGQDIRVGSVFDDYPNPQRPVDFVILDSDKQNVLAIGLARYDSDRGGAQEDDRTGGYQGCADEILSYATEHNLTKNGRWNWRQKSINTLRRRQDGDTKKFLYTRQGSGMARPASPGEGGGFTPSNFWPADFSLRCRGTDVTKLSLVTRRI